MKYIVLKILVVIRNVSHIVWAAGLIFTPSYFSSMDLELGMQMLNNIKQLLFTSKNTF